MSWTPPTYTDEERYDIAKYLENILAYYDYDLLPEHSSAIEKAINIVSPKYISDLVKDLEDALKNPDPDDDLFPPAK